MPQVFKSPDFAAHDPHISYGFFGRQGGVSVGTYTSLNGGLKSGDDIQNVEENRRRVSNAVCHGARGLYGVDQVHGVQCKVITSHCNASDLYQGDAIVTQVPNKPIAIVTADCAPVLLSAWNLKTNQRAIGAAHAGWRGALAGVLEATVEALAQFDTIDPSHIHACIGPCIAQDSYEVQADFYDSFCKADPTYAKFFLGNNKSYYFDLKSFCAYRLNQAGIDKVTIMNEDTYKDETTFFSHRRAQHKGEHDFGRQISAIALI